jgi:hypothetical protein
VTGGVYFDPMNAAAALADAAINVNTVAQNILVFWWF